MELPGPRSEFVDEMLRDVVAIMVEEFGINEEEAAGRVRRDFGEWDLESLEAERMIGHEDANYWANTIYWGPGQHWWRLSRDELVPRPWP